MVSGEDPVTFDDISTKMRETHSRTTLEHKSPFALRPGRGEGWGDDDNGEEM